jgi:membrane protease YdiL (CAAX protease family)
VDALSPWLAFVGLGTFSLPLVLMLRLRLRLPRALWTLVDAGWVMLLLVWASVLLGLVLNLAWTGSLIPPGDPPMAPAVVASVGAGLLVAAYILRRAAWVPLGLGPVGPWKVMQGLLWVVPVLAATALWSGLLQGLGVAAEDQQLIEIIRVDPTSALSVVVLAWGFIGAPLSEELLFRGFLLPPTVRVLGRWVAVVVNGLLFGIMHASDPQAVLPLVGLGALLADLRWRTGSLWPCVALHSGNNAVALILVLVGAA